MDHELELQKQMFGIWLKNIRKKAGMIQLLGSTLGGQHGMQQISKMLEGFARDCENLYQLGYEVGYVNGVMTSEEKPAAVSHLVN